MVKLHGSSPPRNSILELTNRAFILVLVFVTQSVRPCLSSLQRAVEVQVCSELWFWEICALVMGYLGPTPLAAHVAAMNLVTVLATRGAQSTAFMFCLVFSRGEV